MQYMKLDDSARTQLLRDLAGMPGYLSKIFESLPRDLLTTAGPDGMFSPVEQVWHLADLEEEGFGSRIERLLNEVNPQLPDFDGTAIARARNYQSLSVVRGLERFEAARLANLERLRSVPDGAWVRSGVQSGVGEVSLCDMPVFLLQHDQAHKDEIRQWERHTGRVGLRPDFVQCSEENVIE
jgi:hypothetical protein